MQPPRERDCSRARMLLGSLPGHDLTADESRLVREHLAMCRPCQRQLGDQLQARAVLRQLAPAQIMAAGRIPSLTTAGLEVEPQAFFADLRRSILVAVEAESRMTLSPRRRAPARFAGGLARAMTVAALLLLALSFWPRRDAGLTTPDATFRAARTRAIAMTRAAGDYASGSGSVSTADYRFAQPIMGLRGREWAMRSLDLDRPLLILGGQLEGGDPLLPRCDDDGTERSGVGSERR